MIVDQGIYVDGVRVATPADLSQSWEQLHATGGMAWIDLDRPTDAELASIEHEFGLDPLAIEDASKGHQRAKLERYGANLFMVLRPAAYRHDDESVVFGEIHVFLGANFVVTVRHSDALRPTDVRGDLEANPDVLARGPRTVLCRVLDEVVDGYAPVVEGLQSDIDEIEDDLFDGQVDPESSRRIYQILSETIRFQRAVGPVPAMVETLLHGAEKTGADEYGADERLRHELRNVLDHTVRVLERVDTFRTLLENALTLHSTLVTQEQNESMRELATASLAQGEESRRLARLSIEQGEQVKRISSWAAILFAPTLIASIYGMNFDHMPELHWTLGYPFAVLMMILMAVILWAVFKRSRWL